MNMNRDHLFKETVATVQHVGSLRLWAGRLSERSRKSLKSSGCKAPNGLVCPVWFGCDYVIMKKGKNYHTVSQKSRYETLSQNQ